jgi:large subunit ribosomal protein L35
MPKQKTHKGAAKRYKVTGSGKIARRQAWRGHNKHKKTSRRWRRVQGEVVLGGGDAKRAARLLGR